MIVGAGERSERPPTPNIVSNVLRITAERLAVWDAAERRLTLDSMEAYHTSARIRDLMTVSDDQRATLQRMSKGVSRSFYLTIRVLPSSVRYPVQLAYLLARAADTVADAGGGCASSRLEYLQGFRVRVCSSSAPIPVIESGRASAQHGPEADLLGRLPLLFDLLDRLPGSDLQNVRKVVETLTRGMELDLTRFGSEGAPSALGSVDDLDEYVYRVAGCVGEFWTDVMFSHTDGLDALDRDSMVGLGIRFGKALQLTNILRDALDDLRIGRCYVPLDMLSSVGLTPSDLLDPACAPKARPLLASMMRLALDHYGAAEQYISAVPTRHVRLRLSMIWPALIGLATLSKVARNRHWPNHCAPAKVSRRWVYWMMPRSIPCAWSNAVLAYWARRLAAGVEASLQA